MYSFTRSRSRLWVGKPRSRSRPKTGQLRNPGLQGLRFQTDQNGLVCIKEQDLDQMIRILITAGHTYLYQCFGSGSARIRIKKCLLDPDPGGKKA